MGSAEHIFIFGYGSFQHFSSIEKSVLDIRDDERNIELLKKNTCSDCSPILQKAKEYDGKIRIARVHNIKRGWFIHIGDGTNQITQPWTALGAYEKDGYTCNGTLFPVTEQQMSVIDVRETGYIRQKIEPQNIILLRGSLPIDAVVYFYAIRPQHYTPTGLVLTTPTSEFPIIQSYVDLCMSGCCQIDEQLSNPEFQYTNEFVETTHEWRNYDFWINDRIYPRRPFVHIPFAEVIDRILHEKVLRRIRPHSLQMRKPVVRER